MSNPTVSFRISDYHLARGLRAIRILEPNWPLTTPAQLIRTIFNDYIAKSETRNNTSLNILPELIQEIALSRANLNNQQSQNNHLDLLPQLGKTIQNQKSPAQLARELEEEKLFTEMRREALEKQTEQKTAQEPQESDIEAQIILAAQTANRLKKSSSFIDPNITESDISSVTDFSPPKDWKE